VTVSRFQGRPTLPSVIAWSVWSLVLALSLANVVLHIADGPRSWAYEYGFPGGGAALGLGIGSVGLVVALLRRSNTIGWLLLLGGLVEAVAYAAQQYAIRAVLVAPGSLPAGVVVSWIGSWTYALDVPLLAALALLFPDGRPPTRRWRPLMFSLVGLGLVLVMVSALPLPGGQSHVLPDGTLLGGSGSDTPASDVLSNVAMITFLLLAVAALLCVVSLVLRFRRSDAEVREQIKWFLFAGAFLVAVEIALPFGTTSSGTPSTSLLGRVVPVLFVLAALGLPAAVMVAILRYRLYGIDVVINRALVYGSLAALITGVYVGIAVGIGELVGSGGRPNLGLSILATAIVALGFQPARERLQRVANRLVYGKRATPYQVLSEFSSNVAGSYAADEVLPRMARVLQEGTGAESTTVWLRSGDELRVAASYPKTTQEFAPAVPVNGELPQLPDVTRAVEVRHQGELLGALSVNKRRGESLTPVEEKLLDDLAHQAGLVLKNVGLTADLQRRLGELRASRQRLVSAQDAERRRLERNLHDGAQQHLVALKVKLGLAEMLAAEDPERAKALVQQLKADTDEALETVRDLARGIYPPMLAEKGLAAALESQARKATVPVTVDADGVGRYSQDVEATVYFCVLEALQNVQKYADATHVRVRLSAVHGEVCFDVEDDGRGFDVKRVKRGAGLTNMVDRLDALGGGITVASGIGTGTVLRGHVRVAASESADHVSSVSAPVAVATR
jgi:signal transduction histidine kinase